MSVFFEQDLVILKHTAMCCSAKAEELGNLVAERKKVKAVAHGFLGLFLAPQWENKDRD